MRALLLSLICLISLGLFSCDDSGSSSSPNSVGGSSDLAQNKTGASWGVYLKSSADVGNILNSVVDSVSVSAFDGNNVSVRALFIVDTVFTKKLDTLLGSYIVNSSVKNEYIKYYADIYNVKIDTSDKRQIRILSEYKYKNTSEGVQDFIFSKGDTKQPFTIVKYSSSIGDKYTFTTASGVKVERTVVSKATKEDYALGQINIKTIRIDEVKEDPLIQKITYIANHKFGLVGAIIYFKNGKTITVSCLPWQAISASGF
jgi:hypothetical protein